jgi:transposase-like protein
VKKSGDIAGYLWEPLGVHPKIETRKLGTLFRIRKEIEVSRKNRVFAVEFKVLTAQRILNGESVSALNNELGIKRSVLYRWLEAYRSEGTSGLRRPIGRPPGGMPRPSPSRPSPEEVAARHIAELQRKVGQQAVDIDFLRRAFKRVKTLRQNNMTSGETASTERSEA